MKKKEKSQVTKTIIRNNPKIFNPSYFEATFQLRPFNQVIWDYIQNQILKRKDIFISGLNELPEGIDIKLSSRRFAIALGRKLKRVFKGDLRVSRKLFGFHRETSKTLYRITVLYRCKKEESKSK